jgi:hypothetical protein
MHLHEKESHDTELKGSDMKLRMWGGRRGDQRVDRRRIIIVIITRSQNRGTINDRFER